MLQRLLIDGDFRTSMDVDGSLQTLGSSERIWRWPDDDHQLGAGIG